MGFCGIALMKEGLGLLKDFHSQQEPLGFVWLPSMCVCPDQGFKTGLKFRLSKGLDAELSGFVRSDFSSIWSQGSLCPTAQKWLIEPHILKEVTSSLTSLIASF